MVCETEPAFLYAVIPHLERRDFGALLDTLAQDWPPRRLTELLSSPNADVLAAAAKCLGYTGSMLLHGRLLVPLLRHSNDDVAAAADEALWRLWMCAAGEGARGRLALAIDRIRSEQFEPALRVLRALLADEPLFAEAHHQSALALHSLDQLDAAEAAYADALRLNPDHFAAWAGVGHVRAQRCDVVGALDAYRAALRINPRMEELREIVPQLENAVRRRVVA